MFYPAEPTTQAHHVFLLGNVATLVQLGRSAAEVLLDALAKPSVAVPKDEADVINTTRIDWKNLIVALQFQIKVLVQVVVDLNEQAVQEGFVLMQEHHIVSVSEVIFYSDDLLNPMVEIREVEIGEILRQIIANRNAFCAVYNLVEKPQGVLAFDFSTNYLFQYVVVNTRIEFPYVNLQTVARILYVLQGMKNFLLRSIDTSFLDARKRIRSEDRNPDWFKYVHNCVVYYSVGIVRQSED